MHYIRTFIVHVHFATDLRLKILTPPDFSDHQHSTKYPFIFELSVLSEGKRTTCTNTYLHRYPPKLGTQSPLAGCASSSESSGLYSTDLYPNTEWALYLVTNHNFIYGWLDGQLTENYNHLMDNEPLDELIDDYGTIMDYIQNNLTFINMNHTCMYGTNVGASLVLHSLSSQADWQCGIAIAPIIQWNRISCVY